MPNVKQAPYTAKLVVLASRQSDVWGLYQDIKTKDQAKIARRLQESYGNVYDAAAKIGVYGRIGSFTQGISVNAAVAMLVNDPVFPELTGILYNNYALYSAYDGEWLGVRWKPALTYGVRRVMEQSFTVGQLLDTKPNMKLKTYPYRFFAEGALEGTKSFSWGELLANAEGVPLFRSDYMYWQVELGYRTRNLLEGVSRKWPWRWTAFTSFSPLYGGTYAMGRTVKVGTSVEWFRFLQTDFFLMDGFRPAGIVRVGTAWWNAQLFTFARSEDDYKAFNSRQYGLSVQAAF